MSEQNDTTPVEYRTIARFPGYLIGSDGTVIGKTGRPVSRRLRGLPHLKYWAVSLYDAHGQRPSMTVHRLVMEAFRGPCPKGKQVAHNNGDPHDNRLCNLRYCTAKENAADRDRHGTTAKGERSGQARLTTDAVLKIRRLHACGVNLYAIASAMGTSRSCIAHVVKGRGWRHLAREMPV